MSLDGNMWAMEERMRSQQGTRMMANSFKANIMVKTCKVDSNSQVKGCGGLQWPIFLSTWLTGVLQASKTWFSHYDRPRIGTRGFLWLRNSEPQWGYTLKISQCHCLCMFISKEWSVIAYQRIIVCEGCMQSAYLALKMQPSHNCSLSRPGAERIQK